MPKCHLVLELPPVEREAPDEYLPDERMELPLELRMELELLALRTAEEELRIELLLLALRTAEEELRTGVVVVRTDVEELRTGVVVVRTEVEELRTGVVVVVRFTVGLVVRVAVVTLVRVGVAALVRVVVVRVALLAERVAAVRVAAAAPAFTRLVRDEDVRTALLPNVRSAVVRLEVLILVDALRAADDAARTAVRRLASKARAFTIPRDALRVTNERSGWRVA